MPPKNETLLLLDCDGLKTGKRVPIKVQITESTQLNKIKRRRPAISVIIPGL